MPRNTTNSDNNQNNVDKHYFRWSV